ncbi:MAG: NAD(P)H-dependent oxidoreductase subunit E [Bacteroidales bacterium]|nr:NAD(P)H-dependent oxidoreductase subunit E [Candidatus Desulfobacula maris]MBL6949115.1 NAD(P)H-dependent oxidoreductase subunit E [Bacteroidales bacterium]
MMDKVGAVAVLGGGISGMQAALDLAESGLKVYLVDNKPSIGGVMAQLDKTFPTNDCAMCTMAPRLVEIGRHKDIEIITLSDIEKIKGEAGNFNIILNKKPTYLDEEKCTGCGTCIANCPTRNLVQPLEKTKVELEPQFREKVLEIIKINKDREGPLMSVLQQINSTFNYLPENALKYVSQELGYPLSHILMIATFYSSFSLVPRGKHIINICMGTACYVKGGERLMDRFSEVLEIKENETTPDMLFTLKTVRCIGCCGLAPAAMIGDNVYGKLSTKDIPGIIEKYKTMG